MMPPELRDAAERATGFMPTDEGLALYDAALQALPHGPVLEIGTYCGKSTIYLAAAARDAGGRVITIDHHRGSEEHQVGWDFHDPDLADEHGTIDTLGRFRQTLAAAGLESYVIAVVGRSTDVAAVWQSPLGMVFIDGGHSDEAAQSDFDAWAHRVVHGGLLVIHDVFPDPADGGRAPYRIYRRALDGGSYVEHQVQGSLRVLRRVQGDAGGPVERSG